MSTFDVLKERLLLTTLGAYCLLAYNDERDLSHALAPFLHRKQAVCPKSDTGGQVNFHARYLTHSSSE